MRETTRTGFESKASAGAKVGRWLFWLGTAVFAAESWFLIARLAEAFNAMTRQLRGFRQVYDTIPWNDLTQALPNEKIDRPPVPNYADFVDRTVTGQEDLMLAFQELFIAPTSRHVFSFALAAFIPLAHLIGAVTQHHDDRFHTAATQRVETAFDNCFVSEREQRFESAHATGAPGGEKNGSAGFHINFAGRVARVECIDAPSACAIDRRSRCCRVV